MEYAHFLSPGLHLDILSNKIIDDPIRPRSIVVQVYTVAGVRLDVSLERHGSGESGSRFLENARAVEGTEDSVVLTRDDLI